MSRYALIVGIGDYRQLDNLSRPRGDAQAVYDLLREHGNFDDIYALLDEKATGDALLKQLEYVLLEQGKGNEVLLYFTGHGFTAGSVGSAQPADGAGVARSVGCGFGSAQPAGSVGSAQPVSDRDGNRTLSGVEGWLQQADLKLLLIVDQFEEVFTLCEDKEVQRRFVNGLLSVKDGGSSLAVVMTMRSDFVDDWLRAGLSPEVIGQGRSRQRLRWRRAVRSRGRVKWRRLLLNSLWLRSSTLS